MLIWKLLPCGPKYRGGQGSFGKVPKLVCFFCCAASLSKKCHTLTLAFFTYFTLTMLKSDIESHYTTLLCANLYYKFIDTLLSQLCCPKSKLWSNNYFCTVSKITQILVNFFVTKNPYQFFSSNLLYHCFFVFSSSPDCHNTTNNKNNHVLDNSYKCKPENVEYCLWVALLSVCDIGMAHAGKQIWKSLFPLLQSMEHPMDVWSPKNIKLQTICNKYLFYGQKLCWKA